MIQNLFDQLKVWENDDSIACVVLDGAGDKAFCAGGDVRALYYASQVSEEESVRQAKEFFTQEYELDYFIHQMKTPVVVWGDGIVMGGGLGLMAGANHRVVTERSNLAMPEVTIGLYPDVGGTYFLNRMPDGMGLFLGLTGYRMSAADAKYVKLADILIDSNKKEAMFENLREMLWDKLNEVNDELISYALTKLSEESQKIHEPSVLFEYQKEISMLMEGELIDIERNMKELKSDKTWLEHAKNTMLKGSLLSKHLIYYQLHQGHHLSLSDVFRQELSMSVNCIQHGDFIEGVRALLIDKDGQPRWKYKSHKELDALTLEKFVTRHWNNEHPLTHLK